MIVMLFQTIDRKRDKTNSNRYINIKFVQMFHKKEDYRKINDVRPIVKRETTIYNEKVNI